ncbi:DUF4241 domain-containing protein [Rhizobium deserti]|uniref:DUF4241 domain-containing protein n=1 Tax=Rhizobium deserti TaxID=2547961 RepID=UPI001AEE2A3F|nr:DUF4241 domain-containing protein [Rhizobium deserti]
MKYAAAASAALSILAGCEDKQLFNPGKLSSNLAIFTDTSVSLADRKLVEIRIGDLTLPDGKLVAFDPLVQPERKPFERTVAPGTYPVSFIRGAVEYSRPAMLVIRFSNAKVERFELATVEGQDVGSLKDDEFYGIGVDAGIAGFGNATYGAAQAKFEKAEQGKPGSRYSTYYDDVISRAMPGVGSDEFVVDHPLSGEDGAAAMTQAGWGDGYYPTFWGLDGNGKPALALIEFFVITDGDGHSDLEKEKAAALAGMSAQQQADNKFAYEALKAGDETGFAAYLRDRRIGPKDYVLESGGSFMLEAIRLDRPIALRAMLDADATNELGPHDAFLGGSYSEFAKALTENAEKAKAEGKDTLAPRSPELMAVIAELESAPTVPIKPSKSLR